MENLKKEIEEGMIIIENEQVQIAGSDMEVEYGFKIEKGRSEFEIEIKWK